MKWIAVVLVGFMAAPVHSATDCTGAGALKVGQHWELVCAGTCTEGNCNTKEGTDATGPLKFCGCNGTDFDTCCTVVLRDGDPVWYGSCTAAGCTGGGPCALSGSGKQPICPR